MNIDALRTFLLWCSILNVSLMMVAFFITAFVGDWVYRMHSRWYPIPRETYNVLIYSFLGVYKLFIWVFNIVPYFALLILG